MSGFYHSVCLDKDLCVGCVNCIKHCPTEAIRVRNGKAVINGHLCIDCGECIRICGHHAKVALRDHMEALKKYRYTVALPAPSLYHQFNNLMDVNIVLNSLLHIGFDDVFEVSAAAELVSEVSRRYVIEHDDGRPLISTACPTVLRLIKLKFPSLIERLIPIRPPVEVAAELAAKRAMERTGFSREEIGICFISPCPSKVSYVRDPIGIEKSNVDVVLAIKDVYPKLLAVMKSVSEGEMKDLSASGRVGIHWGCSHGEADGLLADNCLVADGIGNVMKVLENMEDQMIEGVCFVELDACSGGCVGGTFTVENPYMAVAKSSRLLKNLPMSKSRCDNTEKFEKNWTAEVVYQPVLRIGSTVAESFSKMNQVERLTKRLPGLDCGSCGAPNCKALAEDIVRGEAEEKDCVHFLREKLYDLSQEVSALAEDLDYGRAPSFTAIAVKDYLNKINGELSGLVEKYEGKNGM